ncbi:hypothetical protein H2198_004883 [Neophaeococcomyces mojaviensis]|uniref:Uncharacterized protein n=1 Tax=Neophaeococcomyces mojaviensis TaxID=3383035 RepID=A0ACC3A7J2_9EURO|nr:hypothetical protein H2198_004883 [Knufia sp. JES_112]
MSLENMVSIPYEDKESAPFLPQTQSNCRAPQRPWMSICMLVALATTALALTATLSLGRVFFDPSQSTSPYPKPSLQTMGMDFAEDFSYGMFAENADALWADLVPPGRGFIHKSAYPVMGKDMEDQRVSAYHQLHCLAALRSALRNAFLDLPLSSGHNHHHSGATLANLGNDTVSSFSSTASDHHGVGSTDELDRDNDTAFRVHIDHCLDYLRQAVICYSDPTVEYWYVQEDPGSSTGLKSDWKGQHVCPNDWQSLWNWSYERRTGDATGLGLT